MRLRCSSSASLASISCVYLMRLRCSSSAPISSVLFYASRPSRLIRPSRLCYSMRLVLVRPNALLVCLVCLVLVCLVCVCSYNRSFKRVKPVNSFKRLVLLIRSIPNFPSVYLLKHCDALKSTSLKPEGFEVFNSVGVFGEYGEYGEIKGVRRVRGFPLIRMLYI